MPKFLVMTEKGKTPPKYIHHDIQLARAEALRLHQLHNCSVLILEVVGEVKKVSVPVTELKTQIIIDSRLTDDLPF